MQNQLLAIQEQGNGKLTLLGHGGILIQRANHPNKLLETLWHRPKSNILYSRPPKTGIILAESVQIRGVGCVDTFESWWLMWRQSLERRRIGRGVSGADRLLFEEGADSGMIHEVTGLKNLEGKSPSRPVKETSERNSLASSDAKSTAS